MVSYNLVRYNLLRRYKMDLKDIFEQLYLSINDSKLLDELLLHIYNNIVDLLEDKDKDLKTYILKDLKEIKEKNKLHTFVCNKTKKKVKSLKIARTLRLPLNIS